mgnify:CR=1 FL=1
MYLKMYLGGNETKVWDEIAGLEIASLNPEKLQEIQDVCKETMRRVKVNIERIVNALMLGKTLSLTLGVSGLLEIDAGVV